MGGRSHVITYGVFPVKNVTLYCPCKRKPLFLGNGKLIRKSVSQNIILIPLNMPCRRKKRLLVDGIVRGRLTTPNGIGRVERMNRRRKR